MGGMRSALSRGIESSFIHTELRGWGRSQREVAVSGGVPRPCRELGLDPEGSGESLKDFKLDTQLDNYCSDCVIQKG